jgi:CubicO group peptidase (beta-lactamase class C family)
VLQERILNPLGMTGTVYAATEPMPDAVVPGYHLFGDELVDVSATHLSAQGAEGGIVSTTADLTRLAQALAAGELLSPASREAMTTFIPSERPGIAWGMGIATMQSPSGELLGMGGAGPGYAARMFLLPAQDLTVVLLTNTNRDDELLDLVLLQVVAIAVALP